MRSVGAIRVFSGDFCAGFIRVIHLSLPRLFQAQHLSEVLDDLRRPQLGALVTRGLSGLPLVSLLGHVILV